MSSLAPPLTVALLTYNRLHYLKEAIAAILAQTYGDFEFLILDNHSVDGTSDFLMSLNDPRIRYVRNAPNTSVQFNCISAYHIASGRRVIATHDDDIMEKHMLENQMNFLDNNPDVGLVWTNITDIDQDGKQLTKKQESFEDRIFKPGEYLLGFLRERLWPMPSGVMFNRALLPKGYSESYLRTRPPRRLKNPMDAAGIEDILLPARINQKNSIAVLGKPLLRRRLHTNQFTHAASLSRPGVYLYRGLRKIARRIPEIKAETFQFDAHALRFDIQDAITSNEGETISKNTSRKIETAFTKLAENIHSSPEAFLAGLPVILLRMLISTVKTDIEPQKFSAENHHNCTKKLLAWTIAKTKNLSECVLDPLEGKRIIIFGSAFIAALLILEAKRHNLQVVACIDSNSNRQGKRLLGIPIQAPTWMSEHVLPEDIIIISSERDHEHYIEAIIRQHLRSNAEIISWKNLIQ
ncbi:MAG: glycosyltransferase family 2 protein [Betaproteobacteria bacterium HGW-Betaproteobacteria-7]|jgi:glycosyltransferase involved in cell wall biosynthesis|nr:MAG: glycosyltransferase family 2 protein [Betaproteobacteria bacterium HGW-Betaproteobacteria-7]